MSNTTVTTSKINEGDIFCSSWGYDQTNIDFYQVVKKTDKTLKLRKVATHAIHNGDSSGYTVPMADRFVDDQIYSRKYNEAEGFVKLNSYA